MKQTKKLTRRQRSFLESKGYKGDLSHIRYLKEDGDFVIYYDFSEGRKLSFPKSKIA